MRLIDDWRDMFNKKLVSGLDEDVGTSWLFHPDGARLKETPQRFASPPEICSVRLPRIKALIALIEGIPWMKVTFFRWQPDCVEIQADATEASLIAQILHGFWNDLPVSDKLKRSIVASMESRQVENGMLRFSGLLKIRINEDMDLEEEALQILEAAVVAIPV